ncbi:hypothetical protein ACWD26_35355 [Streptomyces sp. NPDC002787]
MRSFKRWLDRSLTLQAVLVFLMGMGVNALFRRDEHPVWWVVQSVLYTAIIVAFLAMNRRKVARAVGTDARGVAELNRKLRHREVPGAPEERAAMRRLVAQHLGQLERGGRLLPYWLGFMALLAAGMVVLGVAAGSVVFPLFFAAGVAAFCWWILRMRRRFLERCRSMDSALREGSELAA